MSIKTQNRKRRPRKRPTTREMIRSIEKQMSDYDKGVAPLKLTTIHPDGTRTVEEYWKPQGDAK